ncbi:hypothetical protein ACFL5Y_01240, partial [Candidatus Omnitrophota bacterium]
MNNNKKENRIRIKRTGGEKRPKKGYRSGFKGWLRATALVTLVAFTFNTICQDYAFARGAVDPSAFSGALNASDNAERPFSVEGFQLPEYLGEIKDRYESDGKSRQAADGSSYPAVIHIQDAHCNYYAQHRIAEIIEYLNKEYGISAVNLEGGKADYDLSIFTDIDESDIRAKVTDYFVKEGLLNGAEYFTANNPDKVKLWGVEDIDLYLKNLKIYRDSLEYKERVDKYLKELDHILTNLKRHIYSTELLELDTKYIQYKAENLDFKEYLSYLIQKASQKGINVKTFTNIYLLKQTLEEEKNIDFERANKEREVLIDELTKRVSKNALKELVLKTVEFKAKRVSQKDFYNYLVG